MLLNSSSLINGYKLERDGLHAELRAAPVTPLGVVTDLVIRPEAHPVGDRPVLVGLLGQLALKAESLVRRHPSMFSQDRKREKDAF
mmetsp:Transcript_12969/g.23072  ORF Transcript_12969/g.23072 Transcript_12969/m.23072 type:complete len:86 (-) Transcript_12969:9-266(-)